MTPAATSFNSPSWHARSERREVSSQMLWPKKPVRVNRASLFYRVTDDSKQSRGHRLPNPPLCDHSHRSADLSLAGSLSHSEALSRLTVGD
jgi:hypothetical protein